MVAVVIVDVYYRCNVFSVILMRTSGINQPKIEIMRKGIDAINKLLVDGNVVGTSDTTVPLE